MGLWSNTFDRARTGEKRIENTTPFERYLKDVEWVDMGNSHILFAKYDYPTDYLQTDENLLSINDIKLIIEELPSNISIINSDQLSWLRECTRVVKCDGKNVIFDSSIACINQRTDESIHFNLLQNSKQHTPYFMNIISDDRPTKIEKFYVGPNKTPSYIGIPTKQVTYDLDKKEYNIKVVKLR